MSPAVRCFLCIEVSSLQKHCVITDSSAKHDSAYLFLFSFTFKFTSFFIFSSLIAENIFNTGFIFFHFLARLIIVLASFSATIMKGLRLSIL